MMTKLHHPLDRSQRLLIKKKKDAQKNEIKGNKRLIKAILQDKETQDELKDLDIRSILG